ncbi:CxxxxCH/CxxCH domain-containing protein [Geotalea sp. SG265]|uniref:CxxxxCH/CxxCH domain c-type cytochrome n=1 Tax=Geotalea sp. SG265 TaxID=2922867 RepID=UPI001FAF5F44|nr:CxxxxCH/CxxCH domain-containing protein [Geotalea sp. SG265]
MNVQNPTCAGKQKHCLKFSVYFALLYALTLIVFGWAKPAQAVSPLLHSSANLGTKYGNWGTTYDCTTCHSTSTANIKRVSQAINTPIGARNVVFARTTTASSNNGTTGVFGNDLRTYSQNGSQNVCEVCHHQTLHHQYSSAKIADRSTNPHFNNQDCASSCHMHSNGFKAAGCDGCHGNPPITASIGGGALNGLATPATGATNPASPGAHQQHAIDMAMRCATCHSNTVMPTLNNMVYMGFAANSANVPGFVGNVAYGSYTGHTLTAPYTGFAAAPGTAVGVSSTSYQNSCNVYCHGNWTGNGGSIGNPSWVGGSSQGACGTCHGATQAAPPTKANHPKHVGTYGYSCTKCHPNVTNTKSHVQGSVQWRLSTATNGLIGSSATYTANGKAAASSGATGNLAPSAVYGTCNNLYCHSSGQNLATPGAPRTVPQWGNSLTCSDCHGNSSTTLTSGSHVKHVATFACDKCHAQTASNATTIKNTANHVSGAINVAFEISTSAVSGAQYGGVATPRTKTPDGGATYGSCTSIICHSNGRALWQGTVGTGSTLTWGTAGTCSACHGNSKSYYTGTDWRKAFPLYTSYPIASVNKPNSHQHHADVRATNAGPLCRQCHWDITQTDTSINSTLPADSATNGPHSLRKNAYSVTGSGSGSQYKKGDDATFVSGGTLANVTVTYTAGAKPGAATCSAVSCHPTGLGTNPSWNERHNCTDCHKVDLQNTAGYHHAMNNYSTGSGYPTAIPDGSATSGTNAASRRCVMCHVNHDIFSPALNSNVSNRSGNLRLSIATTPTATSGYASSDYVSKNGTGGICISCHNTERTKSTVNRKNETTSTKTPAIVYADYSSMTKTHNYAIASNMKNDGGSFSANCTKCHNGRNGEVAVFSQMTTGLHDRSVRRSYNTLGGNSVDGQNNDANFCFRCHSNATGTGSPTSTYITTKGNKDIFAFKNMTARSKNLYAAFNDSTLTSKHKVQFASYTTHKPSPTDETRSYISSKKQVTCAECHDPHAAGNTVHVAGTTGNAVAAGSMLYGTPGVGTALTFNKWTSATGFATTPTPATAEYQICFKCHSSYNTRLSAWSPYSTASVRSWTKVDKEFSTANNAGFHPVAGINASRNTTMALKSPWADGKLMYCSDCHGNSKQTVNDPRGPHASANAFVLKKPWTGARINGTSDTTNIAATICFDCHDVQAYVSGGTNTTSSGFGQQGTHTLHADHNGWGVPCKVCHVARPHGWDYSAGRWATRATALSGTPRGMLLIDGGQVKPPYRGTYSGQGFGTGGACTSNADCYLVIKSFATSGQWTTSNCAATPSTYTGDPSTQTHTW